MTIIEREHISELSLERDALVSEDTDALLMTFETRIFVANRMQSGSGSRYKLSLSGTRAHTLVYGSVRRSTAYDMRLMLPLARATFDTGASSLSARRYRGMQTRPAISLNR